MINVPFTKRFARKEDGGLSVEAVLVLPLLAWAIVATVVFFDAFKSLHISQKANFAVADMLSRETDAIDDDYLTTMHELFAYLAEDSADATMIRFTVVQRTEDEHGNEETELVWSEGIGGVDGHDNMTTIEERIPMMMVGDQLIVVESLHEWSPAFDVGLASYRFRDITVNRIRFAPQLCFDNGFDDICSPADA